MANNSLRDFSDYVEYFCRIHKQIAHTDERKHFVRLDHQELTQSINAGLYFPVVTLEKLTISYSDTADSFGKSRYIEMLFLDKVPDAGNFRQIEDVQSRMEKLAESFIFKTRTMRRHPEWPELRTLRIHGVEINYVSNIKSLLWGVLLSFDMEMPGRECINEDDFIA
ncbi:MAG: hypothetical protein LBP72_02400 [Dysgonamonadaceae bacterium]|jgi:hypothetical protein|nr:hypothetical protein [Dysgonamonadaceae bacterium]